MLSFLLILAAVPSPSREGASSSREGAPPSEAIARFLLAVAAAGLVGFAICAWGWHRAANRVPGLNELTSKQRENLTRRLMANSPGEFFWTWTEPDIGYTLKRGKEVDVWRDRFWPNKLGYRTGPVAKEPGTFRIVFLGDSWTYGMGVRKEEAFPHVFARLANEHGGLQGPVEAWNLALPGYNLFNYLAAFEHYYEHLQPDAVVICPSSNDNDSTHTVLSNGLLTKGGVTRDQFGDPHSANYYFGSTNSYRYRARWQMGFERVRDVERRLQQRGIPSMLFFTARWRPPAVHAAIEAADISSPYLILPKEFTQDEWISDASHRHGTPAANEVYACIVYRGVADFLDWPTIPPQCEQDERTVVEVFDAPPEGDWQALRDQMWKKRAMAIPGRFTPSGKAQRHVVGSLDAKTGVMGSAATIMLRPRKAARRLRIEVQRLPAAPSLYPLELTVQVPSPSGGSRVVTTVPAKGPSSHTFQVPIPEDLEPGSTLDVVFEAERTIAGRADLRPRSLIIRSVRPGKSRSKRAS